MNARPIYENAHTLRAEDEVAGRVGSRWRCALRKLPRSYSIDYMLMRDSVVIAWLEVKCRDKRYDTLILSLGKVMEGRRLSRETGRPFVVVVSLPDGDFWKVVTPDESLVIALGGRVDRNDPADMEPVAHFDMREFKPL